MCVHQQAGLASSGEAAVAGELVKNFQELGQHVSYLFKPNAVCGSLLCLTVVMRASAVHPRGRRGQTEGL